MQDRGRSRCIMKKCNDRQIGCSLTWERRRKMVNTPRMHTMHCLNARMRFKNNHWSRLSMSCLPLTTLHWLELALAWSTGPIALAAMPATFLLSSSLRNRGLGVEEDLTTLRVERSLSFFLWGKTQRPQLHCCGRGLEWLNKCHLRFYFHFPRIVGNAIFA